MVVGRPPVFLDEKLMRPFIIVEGHLASMVRGGACIRLRILVGEVHDEHLCQVEQERGVRKGRRLRRGDGEGSGSGVRCCGE